MRWAVFFAIFAIFCWQRQADTEVRWIQAYVSVPAASTDP